MQLYAPHCLIYAAVRPTLFAVCSCRPRIVCCIHLSDLLYSLYAAVRRALFAVWSILLFMKARLIVLSVERSAVTAVPFVVYGSQA